MRSPVVLAYGGGIHASAAIPWLKDTHGVDVVTVTLDVGQGYELGELRARALSCGAVRAHVIDARDEFAREILFPSLFTHASAAGSQPPLAMLALPLLAKKLVEMARIERAGAVAHGSSDVALDAAIRALDGSMPVIAPTREWTMSTADLATYVRARQLPAHIAESDCRIDHNLWGRIVTWDGSEEPLAARVRTSRRAGEPAMVDLHFENGVPSSVNGVPMAPAELIECLALIGGQHGIGRTQVTRGSHHVLYDVPAAAILQAAASATGGALTADVCLRLDDGKYAVLSADDRHSLLVNYA